MTSNIHAILSDIHRMLSLYDEKDFLAAAQYRGTHPSVKDVLRALAREARAANRLKKREKDSVDKTAPSSKERSPQALENLRNLPFDELILRSTLGSSTAKMLDFARRHNINIPTRAKESRERLAKRIATEMISLPTSILGPASDELNSTASSQTQGWIDVLRRRRI